MAAPRCLTPLTPDRPNQGRAVAKLAAALRRPGMPWQRHLWSLTTEVTGVDGWAYGITVVTVPRQAGKTTACGPLFHHRALTSGGRTWWTQQTRQDARDTWLDMVELGKGTPLGGLWKLRESNGSEAITYPSGGSFRPFAPTEDALHGKANELVGIDEAWSFDPAQGAALDQAILPTFTTTGGQLLVVSTAGTAWSGWLLGYIERARAAMLAGRRDTIAIVDYGLTDEAAADVLRGLEAHRADPDDPEAQAAYARAVELLLACNPAHGYTLKLKALRQAIEGMDSPADVLRAYGNYWTSAAEQVIPAPSWEACRSAGWEAPTLGTVTLAVDVSPDGADGAITAAWRPTPTSSARVDVIDARPGTSWMVEAVADLVERWRVVDPVAHDSAGPVLAVADALGRRGVSTRPLTTREYLTACAGLLADVLAGNVEHRGRPELDTAVEGAARRQVGDGWAWSRRHSATSISSLVGVTVARWALDHRPPPAEAPVVVTRRRRHSE